MVRKLVRLRASTYAFVGVICVLFNVAVFNTLLLTGFDPVLSNIVAFVLGGQLSFVLHDANTFKDRHPTFAGWRPRWIKFMTGNLGALGVNSFAAAVLLAFSVPPRLVNIVAMAISGIFSYVWTNYVSHRESALPGVES